MHFDQNNAVHRALRRITTRLTELGIPHAVVGGMALFFHGFRRFTEDVDILVTKEGLAELHQKLEGLGYVPPFQGSKHLLSTPARLDVRSAGGAGGARSGSAGDAAPPAGRAAPAAGRRPRSRFGLRRAAGSWM